MEREATGERTREAIRHIRDSGYHFGKVPYGKQAIPAPDHPRMRILVEDDEEQAGTSESQGSAGSCAPCHTPTTQMVCPTTR